MSYLDGLYEKQIERDLKSWLSTNNFPRLKTVKVNWTIGEDLLPIYIFRFSFEPDWNAEVRIPLVEMVFSEDGILEFLTSELLRVRGVLLNHNYIEDEIISEMFEDLLYPKVVTGLDGNPIAII